MYALTVCMWLKSNASPGVGTPFSYAVPGQANELVLIEWGNNPMEILINDKVCLTHTHKRKMTRFWEVPCSKHSPLYVFQVAKLPFLINDGKWHHICVTWTTRDGVWEAFQDGVKRGSGENLAPYHPIKPQGLLILGQEQVNTSARLLQVVARTNHTHRASPQMTGCWGRGIFKTTLFAVRWLFFSSILCKHLGGSKSNTKLGLWCWTRTFHQKCRCLTIWQRGKQIFSATTTSKVA